jgi:hypothetical protein
MSPAHSTCWFKRNPSQFVCDDALHAVRHPPATAVVLLCQRIKFRHDEKQVAFEKQRVWQKKKKKKKKKDFYSSSNNVLFSYSGSLLV